MLDPLKCGAVGAWDGPSGVVTLRDRLARWMPSIRTEAGHNLVVVARPWGTSSELLLPTVRGGIL